MVRIGLFLCSAFMIGVSYAQPSAVNDFRLYLIGDAGDLSGNQKSYKALLHKQITSDTIPSAIIFLGDNIYPKGMPPEGDRLREQSEQILLNQLELVKGFKGKVFFVPGNHDWKKGGKQGFEYVLNQQAWVDSLHNENVSVLPANGCPGPVEVPLSYNVVLIILNTQWWLHSKDKPEGETSGCECKTSKDVLVQLDDALKRNAGKRVIVSGHHPLLTYGEHGGYFSWKTHIFPFTALSKNLYIPLPIIGSLHPLYRNIIGAVQDDSHPRYEQFKNQITQILKRYPDVVYVSGHDHSLQYSVKDNVHYIVSGAGSKSSYAKKKEYAQYVSSEPGYVRLLIRRNADTEVEIITRDTIPYRKTLNALPKP